MKPLVVFDLDGTLIDSEEVIRESYREAGAEPPADFLSLGHHNWLHEYPDYPAIYKRKNEAYRRRLAAGEANLLPAWYTAEELAEDGYEVTILTGAPLDSHSALRRAVPSWPFTMAVCGIPPWAKEVILKERAGNTGAGVYVDDQRHVTVPASWKFVHYTGQFTSVLYEEITG